MRRPYARAPVPYTIRVRTRAWDAVPFPAFQIFLHKAKRKLSTHGLPLSASSHQLGQQLALVSSRPATCTCLVSASSLSLGQHPVPWPAPCPLASTLSLGQHLVPRPATCTASRPHYVSWYPKLHTQHGTLPMPTPRRHFDKDLFAGLLDQVETAVTSAGGLRNAAEWICKNTQWSRERGYHVKFKQCFRLSTISRTRVVNNQSDGIHNW